LTEFTKVYRAVLLAELEDLKHLGRFRSSYGNEAKYFALTRGGPFNTPLVQQPRHPSV